MAQHTIVQGDTLFRLAHTHRISLSALQAANPGVNASDLQIGHIIHIPDGPPTPSSPPPSSRKGPPPGYSDYHGPASNYPDPIQWAEWDKLWARDEKLMKYNTSGKEIEMIRGSIIQASEESGVDKRVILAIVMQESGGNPRIRTTNNGVRNPGTSNHCITRSRSCI